MSVVERNPTIGIVSEAALGLPRSFSLLNSTGTQEGEEANRQNHSLDWLLTKKAGR